MKQIPRRSDAGNHGQGQICPYPPLCRSLPVDQEPSQYSILRARVPIVRSIADSMVKHFGPDADKKPTASLPKMTLVGPPRGPTCPHVARSAAFSCRLRWLQQSVLTAGVPFRRKEKAGSLSEGRAIGCDLTQRSDALAMKTGVGRVVL